MTHEPSAQPQPPRRQMVARAAAVVILLAGAFLASVLTLPLLQHSLSAFIVAAVLAWGAVFAFAVFFTRRLGGDGE